MEETRKKILIVEDDEYVLGSVQMLLAKDGYDVDTATNGEQALTTCQKEQFDLAIVDLKMPGMDGLQVLKGLKKLTPDTMVIIMTAFGSIQNAVEAMRTGASDYITKPISAEEIKLAVQKVLEKQKLIKEIKALRQELEQRYSLDRIIGKSPKMQEIYDLVLTVSQADATVLITGETGTGKELVARTVHVHSARKGKPFVAVNCSALPESLLESELFGHEKGSFTGAVSQRAGRFEQANEGTIFLDEIGDMALPTQAKILRVLQEREFERVGGTKTIKVDVRVIAATNKNLQKAVEEKTFREDLFFRLNVVPVYLPPLRERMGDIPLLVEHFLKEAKEKVKKTFLGISPDALELLTIYPWPGNVRELENCMERAAVIAEGDLITKDCLPLYVTTQEGSKPVSSEANGSLDSTIADTERKLILEALEKAGGVQVRAAKLLGITERSLWHRIKKYNIK